MSDRFVVEADRKVVGVAVRGPGGFKFFSSDPAYRGLENRTFRHARAVARSVAEVTRAQRRRDAEGWPDGALPALH